MKPSKHAEMPGSMVPPVELMKIVGSPSAENYLAVGRKLFALMRDQAGLKASDHVLDVGCGCGRLAAPLAGYLTTGSYYGFDVVPELVSWCRENIANRHGNFRFEHVDVANTFYHDRAPPRAGRYRFPFENGTYDFTILASVFTHMLPDGFVNYLGEVARTLRPGGAALMTFFLNNEESRRMKELTKPAYRYWQRYQWGGVRVLDRERPEGGVSYPEEMVRALLRKNGLDISQIMFGSWAGRRRAVAGQDIIIARKRVPAPLPASSEKRGVARRLKRWLAAG